MNIDALVGEHIATGGQGAVHEDRRAPRERVVKLYRQPPTTEQISWRTHLTTIDRWMRPSDADDLHRLTAWPIEVHEVAGQVAAVLPRAPAEFVGTLKIAESSRYVLRELSYLVKPEYFAGKAIRSAPPDVSGEQLLEIAIALSVAVRALHENDLVYGDFSYKNLLWSKSPERPVFLLDCDTILSSRQAAAEKARAWSKEWEPIPGLSPGQNDIALLATAVGRILTRDSHVTVGAPDFDHRGSSIDAPLRRVLSRTAQRSSGIVADDIIEALTRLRSPVVRARIAATAEASGYAVRVLRDRHAETEGRGDAADLARRQLESEGECIAAVRAREFAKARALRGRFDTRFTPDIAPDDLEAIGTATSHEVFEEALLSGRFPEAILMIGGDPSLAKHPWAARAVEHSLVVVGDPAVRRGDAYPSNASVLWPEATFVDRLVMIRRRQDGGETTQVLSRATGETECSIPIDWSEHDLEYVELRFATSILDASRLTVSKCPVRIGPATESKAYA